MIETTETDANGDATVNVFETHVFSAVPPRNDLPLKGVIYIEDCLTSAEHYNTSHFNHTAVYRQDAENIFAVLRKTLPQGTLRQLMVVLLSNYASQVIHSDAAMNDGK